MTMVQPVLAVFLMATLLPFGGPAHRKTEEGNREYDAQEYEEALRLYTEAQVELPEAPELLYDIGNVLYRRGDYDGAEEAWRKAQETASPSLQPDIAHNLGNARFRKQEFQEAADAYRQSLKLRPGDLDTKRNLELAARRLQEQQKQEEPSPQQQDQEKDEDQKQDNQPQEQQQDEKQKPDEESDKKDKKPDEKDPNQDPKQGSGNQEQNGQDQQPEPKPIEGKMNKEDAERLLDSLENQEKEALKEEAVRKMNPRGAKREKDW